MLTGKSILTQIFDENIIGAKQNIHSLLAQKAKVYLEDKKRCIASISYGPCAEANGEGNCNCDEQVTEDCGCKEITEKAFATNDLLDAVEKAYEKGGLKGVIQGGKQFGFLDATTVDDVLQNMKEIFGNDKKYAAKEIKGFLKPQDYAKYKMTEEVEEELTDKQKKIDKNHNNVLDKQDFMILRGKKKKQKD